MDSERQSRLPAAPLVAVVVVLLLLPALYVLAVGPMGALIDNGYISSDSALFRTLQVIYAPLGICAERCPPFGSFLGWYMKLCGGS